MFLSAPWREDSVSSRVHEYPSCTHAASGPSRSRPDAKAVEAARFGPHVEGTEHRLPRRSHRDSDWSDRAEIGHPQSGELGVEVTATMQGQYGPMQGPNP